MGESGAYEGIVVVMFSRRLRWGRREGRRAFLPVAGEGLRFMLGRESWRSCRGRGQWRRRGCG